MHPRTGVRDRTIRRDYSALLPIVRYGADSTRPDVALLLGRPRDVRLTLDARLQQRVARALRTGIERGAHTRGAAVVLDVESGDVLASVSYPWPSGIDGVAAASDDRQATPCSIACATALYPPGSTFKLLVAAAALRTPSRTADRDAHVRPPAGWTRRQHHPRLDAARCATTSRTRTPHGAVDLHEGLVVSCNAYFAQLAMQLGPRPLLDAVSLFQIEAARPATVAALRNTLPHAGVRPGRRARVAAEDGPRRRRDRRRRPSAAGAVDGRRRRADRATRRGSSAEADAQRLARYMRDVVTVGHGPHVARQRHADRRQDRHRRSGRPARRTRGSSALRRTAASRPIAFAVLVENAGYGARSAAPVAGEIVDAARELGLFR